MVKTYQVLRITVPLEFQEPVSNFLMESGSTGIGIEENHKGSQLKGCFSSTDFQSVSLKVRKYLRELSLLFPEKFRYSLVHTRLKNKDWSRNWRNNFKPVLIGRKIAIVPAWSKQHFSQALVIKIFPQMAFGTGTHPTTQACLLALGELVKPNDKVLDLGTGSGILAIAAARLGAGKVVAIDKDKGIKENACQNFKLNCVADKVRLKIGSLTALGNSTQFDLALANLTGEEIFGVFENLREKVKTGGYLIVSGWSKEESGKLLKFLQQRKLRILQSKERKGWVTVICRK